jgi:hypothetical protein
VGAKRASKMGEMKIDPGTVVVGGMDATYVRREAHKTLFGASGVGPTNARAVPSFLSPRSWRASD